MMKQIHVVGHSEDGAGAYRVMRTQKGSVCYRMVTVPAQWNPETQYNFLLAKGNKDAQVQNEKLQITL